MKSVRKPADSRLKVTAGACILVFNREGQLLLRRRTDGHAWEAVCGMLERGESLEETAARQLLKETGLKAPQLQFLAMFTDDEIYDLKLNGEGKYHLLAVFEVKDSEQLPSVHAPGPEYELRYFSLRELLPPIHPLTDRVLRKLGYIYASGEVH